MIKHENNLYVSLKNINMSIYIYLNYILLIYFKNITKIKLDIIIKIIIRIIGTIIELYEKKFNLIFN